MTEILAAIIALLTGTGIGGGSVLLRQKRNGNNSNHEIVTVLNKILDEVIELRRDFARLEGRLG